MRLVLFDVDGTLVDSQAGIHECMRRTFAGFGHAEPSLAEVRAIIGLSLDHAIARLLEPGHRDIAALAAAYKQAWLPLQDEPAFASRFFPGIGELLASLSARSDLALGIVTGKSRRGVQRLLQAHGLGRTFAAVRTADDCPSKPHPAMVLECCAETGIDPAGTLVIGDTVFDMEMAVGAGAVAVGVDWGYHPAEELLRAGACRVVAAPDEILEALDGAQSDRAFHARVS